MGGQSVEDMERVIAAMRRVVERLQTENDNLKKHPVAGQTQLTDLTKENKKLKVSLMLLELLDCEQQRNGGRWGCFGAGCPCRRSLTMNYLRAEAWIFF